MKKHTRGFTLIELLVVISIIGVLSSVVIASLSVARDKGRVASGLKFATYTYHAFGADAAGQWNFNEASGNALDISGNRRDLTQSSGASLVRNTNTPTGANGNSLPVVAGGNYATTGLLPAGQQPQLSSATISAWFYPTSVGSGAIIAANNNVSGETPLTIYVSTIIPGINSVMCRTTILGGVPPGTERDIGIAPLNKWSHFACSINPNGGLVLTGYVDGKVSGSLNAASYIAKYIDTMSVGGASQTTGFPFNVSYAPAYNGLIDDAAVYMQTLTAAEIQHIYAQGAVEHGLAVEE